LGVKGFVLLDDPQDVCRRLAEFEAGLQVAQERSEMQRLGGRRAQKNAIE